MKFNLFDNSDWQEKQERLANRNKNIDTMMGLFERWKQIDADSATKEISALVEETCRSVSRDDLPSSAGERKQQLEFDDVLFQVADRCVNSAYEIYKNNSNQAADSDFNRAVWAWGLEPFINQHPPNRNGGDIPTLLRYALAGGHARDAVETRNRLRGLSRRLSQKWERVLAPTHEQHIEAALAAMVLSAGQQTTSRGPGPRIKNKKPDRVKAAIALILKKSPGIKAIEVCHAMDRLSSTLLPQSWIDKGARGWAEHREKHRETVDGFIRRVREDIKNGKL